MWFKNIRFYRFTSPLDLTAETLEERLAEHAFRSGTTFDRTRTGWVSPIGGEHEALTHAVGDYIMFCARKDEKLLPASVVNDALAEKVAEIEQKQARKISRKEKAQLKDDVIAALLPRAFSRTRRIHAYLALQDNLLIINTSSASVAEDLATLLRDSIGSLPIALPDVQHAPSDVMTRWLEKQKATEQFVIHQDCELFNPLEDSNVVRCKGQDMGSDEIKAHLLAGKQVKKLGVVWNDTLSCVIAADLTVTRLKFEDMILERAQETDAESEAQQFDQDFAIMSLEVSRLLKSLLAAFGGLSEA